MKERFNKILQRGKKLTRGSVSALPKLVAKLVLPKGRKSLRTAAKHAGPTMDASQAGPKLNHAGPKVVLSHAGPKSVVDHNVGPKSVMNHAGPKSVMNHVGPKSVMNHAGPKSVMNHAGPKSVMRHAGPKAVPNQAGPKSVLKNAIPKAYAGHASPKPIADHAANPPEGGTGWTIHRDVALRLRNISIAELGVPDDPGRELGAFKIRLAGSPSVRGEAGFLVQQRYARKGYGTSATQVSANICTFAAYDEGRLAGTVSLRHDSAEGLAADEIYGRELAALRSAGHRLCEFTRLAVDVSRVSKPVLAGLFHTVFLYATKLHNFDYAVIEVIPRHVAYYRNSLGFTPLGEPCYNSRVNTTGVLMGMPFAEIADHLHRHAGMAMRARKTRSLYAYGFSPAEEAGILGRLQTLHATG